MAQDQQVLGHLLNSLTKDVLGQVATAPTAAEAWATLEGMFSAQSHARVTNLQMQLSTLKKGSMTTAVYFNKMKNLGNELAAAGKRVDDDEMVSFILAGLDFEYNPIISSVLGHTYPIPLSDLYAQVIAYETRLQMLQDHHNSNGGQQFQSSANMPSRSRGGNYNSRDRGNFGRGGKGGRGSSGQSNSNTGPKTGGQGASKEKCQIYGRSNHTALECWYRFEEDFQPSNNNKGGGSAVAAYCVDTNWYVDSGASRHVTIDLDKLSFKEKYGGRDQVHAANGSGMNISNIGHTILRSPTRDLHLNNILHVPNACKSLASVHRITSDNNVLLEFHPNFFLFKDQTTRTTLHQGRCEGGLYPLGLSQLGASQSKQALGVNKPSTSRWHDHLGHLAFPIVSRVLRENELPFVNDSHVESMCDSCQRAKSHNLPYSLSNKASSALLELIHSDVWGSAPTSAGRFSYYVSFIDDYNRYTWIYLLRQKSDVFSIFHNF